MRPNCLVSLCLLLLLIFGRPTAGAPAPPSNLRPDILYTTRGEFVQVGPMRQLTLNAHIEQFAYEPLGLEVAIVGSEVQGDQTIHFVKTMDLRTGHEMNRLTTSAIGDNHVGFILLGWSRSGKYLLLERIAPDSQNPSESTEQYLRWDLSVDPPLTRPIDPTAFLPADAQNISGPGIAFPSPTRQWVVFRTFYHTPDTEGKPGTAQRGYVLYDPDRDTYRLLTLPPGANTSEWKDDTHLLLRGKEDGQQFDVVTGQVSPLGAVPPEAAPLASKKYPDLTLDVEYRRQEDRKGSGGYLESCLLWIRRTPRGKLPLGAAAAGLTPDQNDPQAVWSPTGTQIAFLTHGDLYVTDLKAASELLPNEKMAVGQTLTCAEERQLAMTNLKQIGLALTQYAQDFDEHYPPSEGVNETLYPYLKTRDVFQVGSHPFVFQLPGNTALAKVESPAETVMGTMDLPCARVVLYVDGHVRSFSKEAAP